jgi:hypothetical protein
MNVDSRFGANTNSILYSFSLTELIDFHKKRTRRHLKYVMIVFGIFGLIGLILFGISYAVPKSDTDYGAWSVSKTLLFTLGLTFLATGVLLVLVLACVSVCQFYRQFDYLDDTKNTQQPFIWRLDGEEWLRYLDYIHGPDREWREAAPLSSFCCRRSSYDRLKDRQYGHIVLYGDGLIIDELYYISFRQYSLQGIQLLSIGQHQRILGLRIHTYLKAGKNSRNIYFDVFAPPSVSLEQLQMIVRSYNSKIEGSGLFGMGDQELRMAESVLQLVNQHV